jgi:hypothetical protein
VETYANDIDRIDIDVNIIVAIPTYPDPEGQVHNPLVESVQAASDGARDGIRQAGDSGNRVVGAGLFVYDEATSLDWETFQAIWADR